MADKSLTYFLFFICFWLSYNLYIQLEENDRLFEIAQEQKARIETQIELIRAHQLYIELLERELIINHQDDTSPLYKQPL